MIHINEVIHEFKSKFKIHIENLDFEENTIIGLVGENGAGKTTLMSILSGYLKANKSYNVYSKKENCSVLFIPSDTMLYEFLTVEELLRLVKKYSSTELDEKDMLKLLEIQDKAKCSIDELSLGMKKKLSLLPLFIKNYDVIILDEPFNSVDLGYIYKLKQILRDKKKECTIILSSHILETLADLCDSFVHISDGHIQKVFKNNGDIQQIEGEIFDKNNQI